MLDTNILLDWLLGRDTTRVKHIDQLFEEATELHIPDIIIFEMVHVLENFYRLPRDVVVANLHTVLDKTLFNCNRTLFSRASGDYVNHPAWSFVDACLLQYSTLQRVSPVWSYDKKLVGQSSLVKSPA